MNIKIKNYNPLIAKIVFSGNVFPVYLNDTLETVVERFAKMYPIVAKELITEVEEMRKTLYNENAMSRDLAVIRFASKIPVPVYYAMKFLDDNYWDYKLGLKHYRQFVNLYPKLAIGRL